MKMRIIIFAAVLLSTMSAWAAERTIPGVIAYQSQLFDDGGNPVADGEARVAFRITGADGELLYEEYQTLDVVRGSVSALVGNGLTVDGAPTGGIPAAALDPTGAKYLEVQVGDFPPTSAMEIASVPYATYADIALGAIEGAIDSLAIADGSIAYEDLSDDLKSKLSDEITAGHGADQIIYRDELSSLYRGPESAAKIGLTPGLNYSGANDLQGAIQDIDRAVKRRDERIDTEAEARVSANTALQTNIENEASARGNADTSLQTNIDNEASARGNADTSLQTNIDNEATARVNADATKVSKTGDTISGSLMINNSDGNRVFKLDNNSYGQKAGELTIGDASDHSKISLNGNSGSISARAIYASETPMIRAWAIVDASTNPGFPTIVAGKNVTGISWDSTDKRYMITGSFPQDPYVVIGNAAANTPGEAYDPDNAFAFVSESETSMAQSSLWFYLRIFDTCDPLNDLRNDVDFNFVVVK